MSKVLDIFAAATLVGLNCMVKADDERKNREYAKTMGWKEDGLAVTIMDYNSANRRKRSGYKF